MAPPERGQKGSDHQLFRRALTSKPKKHVVTFLVSLIFLLTFTFGDGAQVRPEFTKEEVTNIENFLVEIWNCFDVPAISLGVIRGRATFATGTGLADYDTAQPVDSTTIFNLGSTSKALVPYILAEIMNGKGNQDGRLRWNTTIKELLKSHLDLEVTSPWADQTLREALTYSASGTPVSGPFPSSSAADMSTMAGLPEGITREDIIRRAVYFMPDIPEFRSSGHYSNLMYTIAAHLAERMEGKPWEQLVQDMVLDKMDMKDSYFAPAAFDQPDIAVAQFFSKDEYVFVSQNESLFDLHPFEPVGSLMASPNDVSKWLLHLLRNLKGGDSGINMLVEDAFVHSPAAHDPQKHSLPKDLRHEEEVTLGHGMGWEVSEYKGRKRYMYTGHLYAYTSQIWLFPDSQTAVYVALNGNPSAATNAENNHLLTSLALTGILYQVSDIIHREKPWVTASDVCTIAGYKDEDERYPVDEDESYLLDDGYGETLNDGVQEDVNYPLPPDAYTGSYGHGLVGDLVVDADESGMLTVSLGRNLKGELRPKEGAPTKLMLKAVGKLQDTYEWLDEKVLEFLPASVSSGEKFQVVRLYLTNKLYYDFERGKMFDTMLVEAKEEEIRKAREEKERKIKEEKEARMKEEAAKKAEEEERKRRIAEMEKKEMLEAVAREKAEEEKKKETDRKAIMTAVAREKAEENERIEAEKKAEDEGKAKQETGRDIQAQAAALEKTANGNTEGEATTSHNKANLVKKDDKLGSHQSHQPYSERDDKAEVESLPPEKVTDGERKSSNSAQVDDKDGVGSGPVASTGLLLVAVLVVLTQSMIHRY